jgi:hypothetical protein
MPIKQNYAEYADHLNRTKYVKVMDEDALNKYCTSELDFFLYACLPTGGYLLEFKTMLSDSEVESYLNETGTPEHDIIVELLS